MDARQRSEAPSRQHVLSSSIAVSATINLGQCSADAASHRARQRRRGHRKGCSIGVSITAIRARSGRDGRALRRDARPGIARATRPRRVPERGLDMVVTEKRYETAPPKAADEFLTKAC
jgi:hypothetical protein